MKSYTDLEQSKVLSEILPHESADMWWVALNWQETEYYVEVKQDGINQPKKAVPCWSLAALLSVLPYPFLSELSNEMWKCGCYPSGICYYVAADSPIDACYEMILKLYEFNLL
jgi:hypothetical protein